MKVGPKLKRSCILEDGRRFTIRGIRPSDRDALREAFLALSPATRYRRFQAHFSDLSPAMLTYLTEVDNLDHVAVVAVAAGPGKDMPVEIAAVARVIRLRDDRRAAEVAITVADALQGQGLGSRLLEVLVEAARERGIERLVAHVLDGNAPMRRLLAKNGTVVPERDGLITLTLIRRPHFAALGRALSRLRWPLRRAVVSA
jgi:GNAT superfamily N-acetyltransferase